MAHFNDKNASDLQKGFFLLNFLLRLRKKFPHEHTLSLSSSCCRTTLAILAPFPSWRSWIFNQWLSSANRVNTPFSLNFLVPFPHNRSRCTILYFRQVMAKENEITSKNNFTNVGGHFINNFAPKKFFSITLARMLLISKTDSQMDRSIQAPLIAFQGCVFTSKLMTSLVV